MHLHRNASGWHTDELSAYCNVLKFGNVTRMWLFLGRLNIGYDG